MNILCNPLKKDAKHYVLVNKGCRASFSSFTFQPQNHEAEILEERSTPTEEQQNKTNRGDCIIQPETPTKTTCTTSTSLCNLMWIVPFLSICVVQSFSPGVIAVVFVTSPRRTELHFCCLFSNIAAGHMSVNWGNTHTVSVRSAKHFVLAKCFVFILGWEHLTVYFNM